MKTCACGKKILPAWKTCNDCDNEGDMKWIYVPKSFDGEEVKARIAMLEKRERELEQKLKLRPDTRGDGCISCHLLTEEIEELRYENSRIREELCNLISKNALI